MTRYTLSRVDPKHFAWIAERDGLELTPDFSAVAALNSDRVEFCTYCGQEHGSIRGMVALSHLTPTTGTVHLVLESPIAYRSLREAQLPLLFEVLDKPVALTQVRRSNERVRKLLKHERFREVATLPGGFQGREDLIVYRLEREEWRRARE